MPPRFRVCRHPPTSWFKLRALPLPLSLRGQAHLLANDDATAAIGSHIDETAPRLPSTSISALAARPLTAMSTCPGQAPLSSPGGVSLVPRPRQDCGLQSPSARPGLAQPPLANEGNSPEAQSDKLQVKTDLQLDFERSGSTLRSCCRAGEEPSRHRMDSRSATAPT